MLSWVGNNLFWGFINCYYKTNKNSWELMSNCKSEKIDWLLISSKIWT